MKKIYPPTHFYFYLALSALLHFTIPIKQLIEMPANLSGIILFVTGAVLNIWTDQLFKKYQTTVKPDEKPSVLLTNGPFAISRNPMYLGMTLFLIGEGILLGSLSSFSGALFFIAAMEFVFIPQEEKTMKQTFGIDYEDYKKRVRRWI